MVMEKISNEKLKKTLKSRLKLKDPRFELEKVPGGEISGSVISDTFKGIKDSERQKMIWEALEERYGERCTRSVGTLLAYTSAEWDVDLAER